jgi:plasmid replication initiation protein
MEHENGLTPSFVITSNDLIEAKYNYSLWEKRVFVYMISTMKRNDTSFKPVRIYIRDLMRFFETHSNNDYSVIRAIPETISKKPFYVPYQTKDGGKRWSIINVLSIGTQPEIGDRSEGNAYIELKFNSDLMPYLLELKEKFTKYDIRNITGLKSIYSIRLYEYLKENEFRKGVFEVSIDELKEMFYMSAKDNEGKELYPLYGDFKKRVLLKAQEDLLEHCDIKFSFWEKKHGKKVMAVVFEINTNEKQKTSVKASQSEDLVKMDYEPAEAKKMRQDLFNALYSQAKVLEISESALKMLIETYPPEAVQQGFDYTMLEFNKGKIKENIDGYFIAAVKNGFTSAPFEKAQKKKKTIAERKIQEKQQTKEQQINKEMQAKRINDKIRELTTADPSITENAVQNVIVSKAGQFRLRVLGIENPDIELFRKDEILREFVKIQIMEAFKSEFEAII